MQKSQTTQEPGLLLSPPRSSPGNVLLVPFLVEKRQNHRFRWRHNVEKESFEKYWWSTLAWHETNAWPKQGRKQLMDHCERITKWIYETVVLAKACFTAQVKVLICCLYTPTRCSCQHLDECDSKGTV